MQDNTCMRSSFICVSAKLQLRLDTICAVKMPNRSARWTDELTVELIEELRKHPELWKVKSSGYLNKYKPEEAWERLTKVCSKKIPDVTTDQVKMKINTLRSNFRSELAKMKKIAPGESTEGVHEPALWYYGRMMFIADQEKPRPSISTISEDENDEEKDEENENQPLSPEGYSSQLDDIRPCSLETRAMETLRAEGRTVYQQRQPQQPLFHPPAMSKCTAKKATQQARDTFYATAMVALRALHTDQFNAFGTTVATKLRKMSDIQQHIAERIIYDVLFRGVMNELSTYNVMALVMPAPLPSQEPSIVQCASPLQFRSTNPCTFTSIAPGAHHHARSTAYPSSPPIPPVATVPPSSTSSFPTKSAGSGDMDVYTHNQQ